MTERELAKYNKVILGKMKNINEMSFCTLMRKLEEEYNEVLIEYQSYDNLNEHVAELFDVMQVAYTTIIKLLDDDRMKIVEHNIKHLEKLKSRGYIEWLKKNF